SPLTSLTWREAAGRWSGSRPVWAMPPKRCGKRSTATTSSTSWARSSTGSPWPRPADHPQRHRLAPVWHPSWVPDDAAENTPAPPRLVVDLVGERHEVEQDQAFTFGRAGDLVVDDSNPYLHRILGRFTWHDGWW